MANIIEGNKIGNHNVDKYNFKVLSFDSDEEETQAIASSSKIKVQEHKPYIAKDEEVDASAMSANSKDSLIESLLKKTDEMSSNFIKLQMKLENMSEEHKNELQRVKQESYEEGVAAGKNQAIKEDEKKSSEVIEQFFYSISKLEKSAKEFEDALDVIKKDLLGAAVDIAKEVIKIELNQNATAVALMLSNELINELQNASKITLKVNPKDHGVISQKLGVLPHISIVSDGAISRGGVIAMSDAGNIDSQVAKRFERVKKAALSE